MAKLNGARIPVLVGEHSALRAIRAVMGYRNFCHRTVTAPSCSPPAGVSERWASRLQAGEPLDEVESAALLADYGIPSPPMQRVGNEAGLLAAAGDLGYPMVLKTASGIAHKTEAGGVVLGLEDETALRRAYAAMSNRLGARALVAPYLAEPGVEMALGVLDDRLAGMLVMVGAGGTLVELLDDKTCALAPSDHQEIRGLN